MKQPITAETLFEDFVEHIEVLVDDVASQVPYTLQQTFTFVDTLGLYYDGAKQWHRKLSLEKTRDNFKEFFAQEFCEVRAIPRTAHTGGYPQF